MAVALDAVAARQGKAALPEAEWAQVLSFELHWMTPAQARAYVARAARSGLLAARDGLLARPTRSGTAAPLGFKPDPEADPGGAVDDPFAAWLARVAERTRKTREHVLADVAAQQQRLGGWITAEAAVLLLAREAGLDVREAAADALARLAPDASVTPSAPR